MIYYSVGEIFDSIDQTRIALKECVSNLAEEQQNARAGGEKSWSVSEIVEHLATVESGVVRIVGKLLAQAEAENVKSNGTLNPPISFVTQTKTAASQKFQAPERIHPQGRQSIAKSLAKLDENRCALINLQTRIADIDSRNTAFPHPFFGDLNLYEWLAVIGMHERRHLQQIETILSTNKG